MKGKKREQKEGRKRGRERGGLPESLAWACVRYRSDQHRQLTQITRYTTHTWDTPKYFDVSQIPTVTF